MSTTVERLLAWSNKQQRTSEAILPTGRKLNRLYRRNRKSYHETIIAWCDHMMLPDTSEEGFELLREAQKELSQALEATGGDYTKLTVEAFLIHGTIGELMNLLKIQGRVRYSLVFTRAREAALLSSLNRDDEIIRLVDSQAAQTIS